MRATPPFFNAGEEGELRRDGWWKQRWLIRTAAHRTRRREPRRCLRRAHTFPQTQSHCQATQRKAAKFPPLPLLHRLPPMTPVPFVRPTTQQEVAYYPALPSLFAPLPQLPFHSTYTTPKPTQNATTSSLVQVPLLLDRYHPIQYFSPNILFLCIEL